MSVLKNILLIILLASVCVYAQGGDVEELNYNFDYACFKGQDDYVYVELYFAVYTNVLEYTEVDGVYRSEFQIEAHLFQLDSLVAQRSWANVNNVQSLDDVVDNQKLFSVNHFYLKPGEYRLTITLKDVNSERSRSKEYRLLIDTMDSESIHMSDIQFASSIQKSDLKNQYYKNGYQVIPNTDRFYGVGLPMLMFYAEIYNLQANGEVDSSWYIVTYSVLNSDEQIIRQFPPRSKLKPGNSTVEVGGFNIITLTSGTYYLQIDVEDTTNARSVSRRSKFFVYRAGDFEQIAASDSVSNRMIAEKSLKLIESVYRSMTEEEIDNEFGASSYIATKEEKNIYKTLDIDGKRQFMPQFWAKRDQKPETPRNEYRDDYLTRMRTAEREFRGFKKGWRSDEGRILLIYGIPDEIERFPSSNENKSYRIWRYFSIQGGVEFVFVDRRSWGDYELVHSNARGELYDEEWERWIDPNR